MEIDCLLARRPWDSPTSPRSEAFQRIHLPEVVTTIISTLVTIGGFLLGCFILKLWEYWIVGTGRYKRWYHSKFIAQIDGYDPRAGSMSEEQERELDQRLRDCPKTPIKSEMDEYLDRLNDRQIAESKADEDRKNRL